MANLKAQIVFKAPVEWVEEIDRIAAQQRRAASAVARALFERGYLAFKRDGKLFEPSEVEKTDPKAKPAPRAGKKEKTEDRKTGTLG